MIYAQHVSTRRTPQSQPIPGSPQVANSAGGYAFPVDNWTRLDRFLILGSEGGSYYATERTLTVENAQAVRRCLGEDGPRVVARVVEISEAGRAPKNDPAIFVLAMALKLGNAPTKTAARAAVPRACRTGTHLFQLAESVKVLGGWGPATRKAFAAWYAEKSPDALARQVTKYRQRNGWTHRDVLRKCHPRVPGDLDAVLRWATCNGNVDARTIQRKRGREVIRTDAYPAYVLPATLAAFERLQAASTPAEASAIISETNLPRECVPTEMLTSPEVWDALLRAGRGMPMTAMIRNLGVMSSVGLLTPLSDAERFIVSRLRDPDTVRGARVHPIAILLAQATYSAGHGMRGSKKWTVSPRVVDALNDAFYAAFANVEATGKRWLLGIDVSGSMSSGAVAGTPLTPRQCAAAMAMVTARTEPNYFTHGFSTSFVPLAITPSTRLDDACRIMDGMPFSGTDCALPMAWALQRRVPVDVFAIYTDNETWAGSIHPVQALREYRERMGIPAKLVVAGFVSNGFTIADPSDAGMLDVVGFDASAPQVMADFAR